MSTIISHHKNICHLFRLFIVYSLKYMLAYACSLKRISNSLCGFFLFSFDGLFVELLSKTSFARKKFLYHLPNLCFPKQFGNQFCCIFLMLFSIFSLISGLITDFACSFILK